MFFFCVRHQQWDGVDNNFSAKLGETLCREGAEEEPNGMTNELPS
jgi:hypothetical protein